MPRGRGYRSRRVAGRHPERKHGGDENGSKGQDERLHDACADAALASSCQHPPGSGSTIDSFAAAHDEASRAVSASDRLRNLIEEIERADQVGLDLFGVGVNIMVLGGLAIAPGEVVDDAIIDSENIFRRLRLNRLAANPVSVQAVVLNASVEVRS